MSYQAGSLTGSVQTKSGRLYAVMSYKEDGQRKTAWRTLNLKEGAPRAKINKEFRRVINEFEQELLGSAVRTSRTVAELPVYDYLCDWLEWKKSRIQINTQTSYRSMLNGKIKAYFTAKPEITVGNITKKDILDFYNSLYSTGSKGASVLHFHIRLPIIETTLTTLRAIMMKLKSVRIQSPLISKRQFKFATVKW